MGCLEGAKLLSVCCRRRAGAACRFGWFGREVAGNAVCFRAVPFSPVGWIILRLSKNNCLEGLICSRGRSGRCRAGWYCLVPLPCWLLLRFWINLEGLLICSPTGLSSLLPLCFTAALCLVQSRLTSLRIKTQGNRRRREYIFANVGMMLD